MENEVNFRVDSSKYNEGVFSNQVIFEEWNSARNYNNIINKFREGKALDISDEPKANGKPVVLIGSGPSLDDAISCLKQWKGGIICTASHAITLIYHNIIPDYIVVIDPFDQWEEFKGIDWRKTKTKLIVHPGIKPEIINNWPNQLLFFIEDAGRNGIFYKIQKVMYSELHSGQRLILEGNQHTYYFDYYIKTELPVFACSPPIQMLVAKVLEYDTIFLSGFDFAFVDDKSRFTGFTIKEGNFINPLEKVDDKLWDAQYSPINKELPDLIETKNGLLTREFHLLYKRNVLSCWRLICKTMYSTDHGALTEVPYLPIEQVVEKQGKGFPKQSKDFIIEVTEKYLASVDGYVIEKKDGKLTFVEAYRSPDDILRYMLEHSKDVDIWHNIKRILPLVDK